MDYLLSKPSTLSGYPLHRMVAGLVDGAKVLFADQGDHLRIRTDKDLSADKAPLREFDAGSLLGFELAACVGVKTKGKHRYFPHSDWRSRHAWLTRKGGQGGFEVVAVHCAAESLPISAGARQFNIDKTTFTGVLKVIDPVLFKTALSEGIGNTGRAFGLGLLII